MKKIKVYIASPYSIGNVDENIRRAMMCAEDLFQRRQYTPFMPLLSHFQNLVHPRTYREWLDWCLEWLKSCDAVLRLKGESQGASIEVKEARKLKIPVFSLLIN